MSGEAGINKGRLALVTGGNLGLGFETSLGLAKAGCKVVMACLDPALAREAEQKILAQVPDAEIHIMALDLSQLSSVRALADKIVSRYHRLDILVNNAGVMLPKKKRTADGFESHLGINYLGHFLLTGLLMPLLRDTANARVVAISSLAHRRAKQLFNESGELEQLAGMKAYEQSKLACLMFSLELERRLRRQKAKAISLAAHPGIANTNLGKHLPLWFTLSAQAVLPWLVHSTRKAARTTLAASLTADILGGTYIGPQGFLETKGVPGPARISSLAADQELAEQLWQKSEELVGFSYLD